MKLKRTLACVFIVAAFPLLASLSGNGSVNSVPFSSVAFAGHSVVGNRYCVCDGSSECICDPNETPPGGNRNAYPVLGKSNDSFNQDASPTGIASTSGFDIGTSAMVLALAVFVWVRFFRT